MNQQITYNEILNGFKNIFYHFHIPEIDQKHLKSVNFIFGKSSDFYDINSNGIVDL